MTAQFVMTVTVYPPVLTTSMLLRFRPAITGPDLGRWTAGNAAAAVAAAAWLAVQR